MLPRSGSTEKNDRKREHLVLRLLPLFSTMLSLYVHDDISWQSPAFSIWCFQGNICFGLPWTGGVWENHGCDAQLWWIYTKRLLSGQNKGDSYSLTSPASAETTKFKQNKICLKRWSWPGNFSIFSGACLIMPYFAYISTNFNLRPRCWIPRERAS